jgi:GNAT superfamily N-acetyltransferase
MTSSWTVRAVRAEDAATIALHRYDRGERKEDIDAYAVWLPPRVERGTYLGFVAAAMGRVVGGASAVLLDWGPSRGEASGTRARIVNVFTEPAWRRQGIARTLVDKVLTTCTEGGIRVSLAASPRERRHVQRPRLRALRRRDDPAPAGTELIADAATAHNDARQSSP